jgi:hypothetical protein
MKISRVLPCHSILFFEQAKGYVKALEKSPSRVFRLREVFEHWTESHSASGEKLKVTLNVLSFERSRELAGTGAVRVD